MQEQVELRDRLRELLKALKRTRKITKGKPIKPLRGDASGAESLGAILGAQDNVYLDYGGSSQIDASNPFNPTGSTPIGANPGGKP